MKRFLRILSVALLSVSLTTPMVSAQRHGGNHNSQQTHQNGNRGSRTPHQSRGNSQSTHQNRNNGSTGRPGLGNQRPNNKEHGINKPNTPNKPNSPNRPNSPNHNTTGHPGLNGNHNSKPNRPGNNGATIAPNRPGNNGHNGQNVAPNRPNNRPGSDMHRPGAGVSHTPAHSHGRPGVAHRPDAPRPVHMAPPARPLRPNMFRPHHRPTPPPHWRPRPGVPLIRGILGLTFGTAINLSLDYLYRTGFTVDGYNDNVVYIRNVSQLNYIWTDAALYYGANGLDASSFYYSTSRYDLSRYNAVYNNLTTLYGQPISINTSGQFGATWFGGNNGYVTLSFEAGNVAGGSLRYITTLTYGM